MRIASATPIVPLQPPVPLAERDDDALMVLAAGDHRAAFEVLVGRYLPRLTQYSVKFLGDGPGGEEVAQEVLVEAWRQRARYRGRGRFPVFLFTIARNRCRNAIRDEVRRRDAARAIGGGRPSAADSGEELDLLLEKERQRLVRRALLALPERHREALLLRFDQGLSHAEIARILFRPEVTVRSRVFHALRKLRRELGEESP